jgi:hypothetical protein
MIQKSVNIRPFSAAHRMLKSAALSASLLVAAAFAQNPVPQIVGPVHPMAVAPGSGAFTLSVYGANFVPGAVVSWNYQPRATTFISPRELQAQILSSDIAKNTAGYIMVANPAPGGGNSSASWAQVEVHDAISSVVVNPPTAYFFGYWALQAADFNHDGILDLAGEYGSAVGLGRGAGDGTFGPWSIAGPYLAPTQFGYGDFNGDGNLDIAASTPADSTFNIPTHMNVMLGDGKGNFSAGPSLTGHDDNLNQVLVGDFNQDGKLDLVTKGVSTLSTYLGNGDGSFRPAARYAYPNGGLAAQMIAGDFNGDGKLDLILLQQPYLSFNNNSKPGMAFWFLQGNGDGTFQKPRKVASFAGPSEFGCVGGNYSNASVQLSDFNGDGRLDLAFCSQTQIGVMLGNGDGTFQPPTFYTADSIGYGQFTFAIGDFNSDGKPDVLVSEYSDASNLITTVMLGNGDGTFQGQQTIYSGGPFGELAIPVADFNSDGLPDFVFATGGGMEVFIQQ